MEGFDPSTMTYLSGPVNMQYDQTPDAYSKMLMQPLESFDHQSNYDAHTFAGYENDIFVAVFQRYVLTCHWRQQ